MRNLLIFLLLLSATAHSQLQSFVVRSGASGDTLFAFNPSTGEYTQLTKQDTSAMPRFTEKIKGLITWANVQSKPSTYTPATHSHAITDVTGLQTALDAKGTSNFDGAYASLTGKPSTFTPSSHTHTISEISNFGSYVNVSDSAAMLLKYLRKQDTAAMLSPYVRANVAASTYQAIGSYATTSQNALKVNISDTAAALSPYLRSNVAAATYQPLGTYATGSGSASGTNTGDNAANTTYANDYRAANFVAGVNYLAPGGNGSGLSGITASQVGLGNVTNESKATMFTSPTFTGNAVLGTPASGNFSTGTFTWPTFNQNTTGTAGGLSADIAESRVTNLVSDLAAKAPLASPAFTGTPTGIGIPVYARVTGSDATTTGQALTNITGLSVALTTNAVYEFEAVLGVTTSAVTTGTQYAVQYSVAGGAIEGGITGPLTSTAAKAERIAALNTATSAYLTTSAQTGQVIIKGIITTGVNAGNLTIQHLKVTSGTSTIKINSFLKVTRIS